MKVTLLASIEIEADPEGYTQTDETFDEAQLIRDFDGYMGECIGLPHGNIFSRKTGEDLAEITLCSIELYEHITIECPKIPCERRRNSSDNACEHE